VGIGAQNSSAASAYYTLLQDLLGSTTKVVDSSLNVTTMREGQWGNSRDSFCH
jgi:hypothetical protein